MNDRHHGHGHGVPSSGPTPERALAVAIGLNGAFLIVEVVLGLLSDSLALLSDAGHMLSDVGALVVALVAQRLRHRKPGASFTFGLRRLPVLGGLVNAFTLIAIVVLVIREAIGRLIQPEPVDVRMVFIAGIAGLLVNVVSAWYLHRSGDRSVNVRGAMLHLISDALGSVAAVLSAVVIHYTDMYRADPLLSLVIAALILHASWPLLRETVGIVLQRAPSSIDILEVRSTMEGCEGVCGVHDLHLWELDSGESILTAIVETDATRSLDDANRMSDAVRAHVRTRFGIAHVTLEWRHVESKSCVPTF